MHESLFVELFGPLAGRLLAVLSDVSASDMVLLIAPDALPGPHGRKRVDVASLLTQQVVDDAESEGTVADPMLQSDPFAKFQVISSQPNELIQALDNTPSVVAGAVPSPPMGSQEGGEHRGGVDALVRLTRAESPPLRVVAIMIPAAALTAPGYEPLRSALTAAGTITHLVELPRSEMFGMAMRPMIVRWQPDRLGELTRIVDLPEDRAVDPRVAIAALSDSAVLGPDRIYSVELPRKGPWDIRELHPGRQALLDEVARRPGTRPLGDVASIHRGTRMARLERRGDLEEGPLQEALPTIRGRDIRPGGRVPPKCGDGRCE